MPAVVIQFVESRIESNKGFIASIAQERPKDAQVAYCFPAGPGEYDVAVKGIVAYVKKEQALLSYPGSNAQPEPVKSLEMDIASAVQDVVDEAATSTQVSPTGIGATETRVAVQEEPGYKACCVIS